eukprot:2609449-Lingulodinium_polyedra.AAC.1
MVCARRANCGPLRQQRVDSNASLRSVWKALRTDAFESTVRRRGGLRVARVARAVQTPVFGVCT